jgi:gamma-glutamyl:cysteine ligase YbdK (ATP-grasp superfamily)
MGKEIATHRFSRRDFSEFERRLRRETMMLRDWFASDVFRPGTPHGGFEIEAWMVDPAGNPAPINEVFLERLNNPAVVPELARFNVEINTPPMPLCGGGLKALHQNLVRTWTHCNDVARTLDAELVMIGILPTLRDGDLCLANISAWERYRALNDQVIRLRGGRPITLDVQGREHLRITHRDVMLEAAATSLQVHFQPVQAASARIYNASIIASAPIVAVAANSPYLFGLDLWDETRIPVFEQAVSTSSDETARPNRVTFGRRYARESLIECFLANVEDFDVLLPMVRDEPDERLCHLRLHNGTIWRWNRPLIGFDARGNPSIRIEHRVIPAGPSLADTMANAALYYGLVQDLSTTDPAPERQLSFDRARSNFYAAAREGLNASIVWLNDKSIPVRELLLSESIPRARRGLQALGEARADIDLYLGTLEGRLKTGQNGCAWQRAFTNRHGRDMRALVGAYRDNQRTGEAVHDWRI